MTAPTIVIIRPGVSFAPAAAASFRRAEADLGRRIQVTSSYRDYNKQLSMYNAWQRYLRGGPKPPHSMALHPDWSKHCLGLALDSNEWVSSSFNTFMAERGWIRTAASDPTERHHYEYQSWRDKHINRPASDNIIPITPETDEEEEEEMTKPLLIEIANADGSHQWAIISPDLARFVPIYKVETINALSKLYGTLIKVVSAEWNGFRSAAGLVEDPNVG